MEKVIKRTEILRILLGLAASIPFIIFHYILYHSLCGNYYFPELGQVVDYGSLLKQHSSTIYTDRIWLALVFLLLAIAAIIFSKWRLAGVLILLPNVLWTGYLLLMQFICNESFLYPLQSVTDQTYVYHLARERSDWDDYVIQSYIVYQCINGEAQCATVYISRDFPHYQEDEPKAQLIVDTSVYVQIDDEKIALDAPSNN